MRSSRRNLITRMKPRARVLALGVMLLLPGCAGRHDAGALLLADETAGEAASLGEARMHRVLVATTRAREDRDGLRFGGERSAAVDFATVSISVPPAHARGKSNGPDREPAIQVQSLWPTHLIIWMARRHLSRRLIES